MTNPFELIDYLEIAADAPENGLMVYQPWSSWIFLADQDGHEFGKMTGPVYFYGRFPQASMRLLSVEEIGKMTTSDLQIMRNEIYARYGYIFRHGSTTDDYFRKQNWYRGDKTDVSSDLTKLERKNIEQILKSEKNRTEQ